MRLTRRRSSDAEPPVNIHGARTGHFLTRLQMSLWKCIFGHEETMEEERIADLAAIIKTYRGIAELDEENEAEHWVDRKWFSFTMAFFILANAVVICVETDRHGPLETPEWYWIAIEGFFIGVFLIEVVLKMCYHGWRWIFADVWNFISTAVLVLMIVDISVMCAMERRLNLKAASLVRILSLVHLRRQIRRNRWLEELRAVFDGIAVGTRAIIWICLLLFGLIYMSAIFLTRQIGHNLAVYGEYRKLSGGWDHAEYFGTMGRSMYTLLQVMTLDGWSSKIVRHVINQQGYMVCFFAVFLLLSNYGVVNIVVSVIVQHICASAEKNAKRLKARAVRAKKAEIQSMIDLFIMTDKDQNGTIEPEEFQAIVANEEFQWRMRALELPLGDTSQLFNVIGGKGSRSLTKDEFVKGLMKLKGPAESKDLLGIQVQADAMARRMDALCDCVLESERMIKRLDEVALRLGNRYEPSIQGARRKIASAAVGSTKPTVRPKRVGPGGDKAVSLATGNRPELPLFPDLLN